MGCVKLSSIDVPMPKQLEMTKTRKQLYARRTKELFATWNALTVTFQNGAAVVKVTHLQSHKLYVNITLPEKWHILIKDNHRLGPAKVCR